MKPKSFKKPKKLCYVYYHLLVKSGRVYINALVNSTVEVRHQTAYFKRTAVTIILFILLSEIHTAEANTHDSLIEI